jgi:hypothetical protein
MQRFIAWTTALTAIISGTTKPAQASLQFTFNVPTGSNLHALQTSNPALYNNVLSGFTLAADRWKSIYNDPVNVRINIDFPALAPSVLGQASSTQDVYSYSAYRSALSNDRTSADDFLGVASLVNAPTFTVRRRDVDNPASFVTNTTGAIASNVVLTRANARALGLISNFDTASDADIQFSSNFNWDFDPSDGIATNSFDFIGVATHEIGHAMGFVSTVDEFDYFGAPGGPGQSSLSESQVNQYAWLSSMDLFRYSAAGVRDVSYNQDAYFSLDGGLTSLGHFSTGSENGDGWQASHWREQSPTLGIFDPAFTFGELGAIQPRDIRALDTVGWNMIPEPATLTMILGAGLILLRRTPTV